MYSSVISKNKHDSGNTKLLYTVADLTEMVPLSKAGIYKQVKSGHLSCVTFGRKKFFRPEEVHDWISRNEK